MKKHPQPTRASVLYAVIEEIQARNNGQIPTDVDGIDAFFHDTGDLADALLLRWHTRLTASLEGGLVGDPESRREAVIEAWRQAAEPYRGVRRVIDELAADPLTQAIAHAVRATTYNDWAAMAVAAGLASDFDRAASRVGRRLELEARRRNELVPTNPDGGAPPRQGGVRARFKQMLVG